MFNQATGKWEVQQISLGTTAKGQAGYFTNGFLVKALTKEEHAKPAEHHHEYARANNYTFKPAGVQTTGRMALADLINEFEF